MKKIFLFAILLAASSGVFAQENEKVLPQRELQVEIGESAIMQLLSGENTSPTISVTHNRRINEKWWYGVSAAYSRNSAHNLVYTGTIYKEGTFQSINVLRSNNDVFSIAPAIKFSYNAERVQMYSGLQAGISLISGKNLYVDGRTVAGSTMSFFFQLTAFGINYGKDFYIGAEAGFGYKGVLNLVAGYRF